MNTPKASVGAPKDVQEPVPSSRDHKEESKEHNDVKNDKKDKTEKKKSKEKERKDREKKAVLLDRGYQVTLNAGWTNSPVEPADVVALCKRHNYNIAYIGLQEVSGRRRIAQIAYQLQQVTKRTFSYVITKVNTSKRPEYVALIWDTSRFTWKATIAPHDASMKAQGYLLEDTDGALRTVIVAHWSHKKTSFDKWVERCHYKSWLATMNSPTILLADFNCTPSDISNSLGVPEDRLALTEGDPATTSGGTGPIDNVVVPFGYHTTNSTVEDVGSSDHHAVLTRFKKN